MSKILQLCLSPDLGGLELYMYNASMALSSTNTLLVVINPRSKLSSYFATTSLHVKELEKKSKLFIHFSAKKLARIIDENSIELIHIHWTSDLPLAVLAKVYSKQKPKLVQSRHMHMTRFKDDFYHRFLYKHLDMMLAVTQQVKEEIETFIPKSIRPKVEVLYLGSKEVQGIDAVEKEGLKKHFSMQKRFAVGMVGRINEAKGQYLLIEAISKIADEKVEAYFVGQEMKEGYIESLKALAKALNVSHRIHFLGFLDKPEDFFQVSDVIVLASKKETFGLVLIEAMQVGTAVIGSNSGGVVEIIDDAITGLLFEVANSDALAEKIEQLYHDETLRKSLELHAKIKAKKEFLDTTQFKKLDILLQEIQ